MFFSKKAKSEENHNDHGHGSSHDGSGHDTHGNSHNQAGSGHDSHGHDTHSSNHDSHVSHDAHADNSNGHDSHSSGGHDSGHDSHGHDSHSSGGHDSHGHDAHTNSHDTHNSKHDSHSKSSHGHDSHDNSKHSSHDSHSSGHSHHDHHGHDEHDEDEHEEHEEGELKDINDIKIEGLEENVDISDTFHLKPLTTFKKLFKKNTKDLNNLLKPAVYIGIKKILILKKLKNPIFDLKYVKKNKPIDINDYKPEITLSTLNLLDLENFNRQAGPYADIFIPKYSIISKLNIKAKKVHNKLLNSSQKTKIQLGVLVFLILLFPFLYKVFVENRVYNILNQVKEINSKDDILTIEKKVEDIKFSIITLKFFVKPIFALNYILNINDIKNLSYLLDSGSSISDSILDMIFVYKSLNANITVKGLENLYTGEFFKNSEEVLLRAFFSLNKGISYLEKVNVPNDSPIKTTFYENFDKLKKFRDLYSLFLENSSTIKNLLGDSNKRTYMVVFQNSDEIRPTGGFMGSVLVFEVYKGKILKYEKKDIYALEWGIKPFKDKAPEGINEIASTFGLRDANYFPNVEESSLKIKQFMDKTQYKIDGIFYINQNIILDFLDYFGGVYFDEVKKELNSSNFSMITSTLVESKVYKSGTLGTPKQILFDFIIAFFEKLKEKGDYSAYANILFNGIKENEILFYSYSKEENDFLNKIGFKNDLLNTNFLDFNYPVFTSISGNKSDRYVKRTFEKKVQLNTDCSINTSLKISSKHAFSLSDELNIKNFMYDFGLLKGVDVPSAIATQGKALNRQYIRLYLPIDAIITTKGDFKVKDMYDRKEVSFFLSTPVSTQRDFNIDYTLLNTDCKKYEYEFVKQPGLRGYDFVLYKNGNLQRDFYNTKNFIYTEKEINN